MYRLHVIGIPNYLAWRHTFNNLMPSIQRISSFGSVITRTSSVSLTVHMHLKPCSQDREARSSCGMLMISRQHSRGSRLWAQRSMTLLRNEVTLALLQLPFLTHSATSWELCTILIM